MRDAKVTVYRLKTAWILRAKSQNKLVLFVRIQKLMNSNTNVSFPKDVTVGETILLDDGKLHLEIVSTNKKDLVKAKVLHGGILSSKKGVNLPNTAISLPCLTEKDKNDLEFALQNAN